MKIDNYSFINIEEINSVILNHGINFEEYYDLNIDDLEDSSIDFTNYRYDFIIVSRAKFGNLYEYILEIRNSLWDGSYSFIKLPENVAQPTVSQSTYNPNILKISGENLSTFIIRLHLSNYVDGRVFESNKLSIRGLKDVSARYYENNILKVQVVEPDGTPVANASITVKMNGGTSSFTTNNQGYSDIVFPPANPGTYDAEVTATKQDKSVKRVVQVERTKTDVTWNITNATTVYKGAINETVVDFTDNENVSLEQLEGASVKIEYKNKVFNTTIGEDGKARFDLNLRKTYDDSLNVKITVSNSTFITNKTRTSVMTPVWFYAVDYPDLERECERAKGADVIRLRRHINYINNVHPNWIQVLHDVTLQGEKTGDGWTNLDFNNKPGLVVRPGITLTVKGLRIAHGNPALCQDANSTLEVEDCLILYCDNTTHGGAGSAVYTYTSTLCKTNKKLFQTKLKNTYFYDNYGSCISHGGQLEIDSCYFLKNNFEYMKYRSEPHVLEQLYGNCTFKNSKVVLDTGETISPVSMAHAKIICDVGKTATLNGKTGSQMASDNSLNFFNSPYLNQSYIYTKYYYPYEGVKANIIASPKKGYEKKAAGHAVAGANWAYKDNLLLTRVSWGTDNKTNKWTISLPTKGGYYVF